jgi:hypothetical protein
LKLEPGQVLELLDYINGTRKAILGYNPRETNILFIGFGKQERFNNIVSGMMLHLR